jgi:hypothetical protein
MLFKLPFPDVKESPFNSSRSRHGWTNQVGPSSFSLTPFEVSVARTGASFSRLENIVIHRQTHAATGLSPFKTSGNKSFIEALFLSLNFNQL